MATERLSDFNDGGVPGLSAYIAGANVGAPNLRYTLANIQTAIGGVPLAGGNLTFYVSTTGSDANSGLSPATAFATIQHAVIVAESFNYQTLFNVTINVANGTYNLANQIVCGPIVGIGAGTAQITGNTTTPTNVVISNTTGGIFAVNNAGARWNFAGLTLKPNDGNDSIIGFENAFINVNGNMAFDVNNFSFGAYIFRVFNYSLLSCHSVTLQILPSGIFQFETAVTNSICDVTSCTITAPVGLVLGNAWLQAQTFSLIDYVNPTFANAGSVSGTAISGNGASFFETNFGLLSDVPASSANVDASCGLIGQVNVSASLFIEEHYAFNAVSEAGWNVLTLNGDVPYLVATVNSKQYRASCRQPAPNTQTGNYTFVYNDEDQRTEANSAGAITFTVPANATTAFNINSELKVTNIGAGVLTIAAAGGVTIHNLSTLNQWASAVIYKRGTNEWVMTTV